MYDSESLEKTVNNYMIHCHNKPSRTGLAQWLSVSHQTISNIISGTFNGHRYTNRPHVSRIVDNDDFEIIRSLFMG